MSDPSLNDRVAELTATRDQAKGDVERALTQIVKIGPAQIWCLAACGTLALTDLKHLRILVAAADRGSFSAAAVHLNIEVSAVSRPGASRKIGLE